MNLLSNAVKFTSKGGYIKIVSKLILKKEDFTYPDRIDDEKILKNQNGHLEIVV